LYAVETRSSILRIFGKTAVRTGVCQVPDRARIDYAMLWLWLLARLPALMEVLSAKPVL
jgi:hypothetical protein